MLPSEFIVALWIGGYSRLRRVCYCALLNSGSVSVPPVPWTWLSVLKLLAGSMVCMSAVI